MLSAIIVHLVVTIGSYLQVTCYVFEADNMDFSIDIPDYDYVDKYPDFNDTDAGRMQIIFPGTKWCGTGNIAASENDIGALAGPDRCCRDHDHCPEFLDPGQSRYGLTNTARLSRLECSCEFKFYDCLKSIGSIAANQIGTLYFNFLVDSCYKQEYPIVNCNQRGFFMRRCSSYALDQTKPKVWQFFDLPTFK